MTEADVDRIEAAVGLRLPGAYRHLLTHFPVRFDQGTANGPVWDDADKLIKRNQELRTPRKFAGNVRQPIPPYYVFIGDDGGGWQHLLDVREDPPRVQVMEFENVATIAPHRTDAGATVTLNEWFHDYLLELKNDGVDIEASQRPTPKLGLGCVLGMIGFCLVVALVIALLVVAIQTIDRR